MVNNQEVFFILQIFNIECKPSLKYSGAILVFQSYLQELFSSCQETCFCSLPPPPPQEKLERVYDKAEYGILKSKNPGFRTKHSLKS